MIFRLCIPTLCVNKKRGDKGHAYYLLFVTRRGPSYYKNDTIFLRIYLLCWLFGIVSKDMINMVMLSMVIVLR